MNERINAQFTIEMQLKHKKRRLAFHPDTLTHIGKVFTRHLNFTMLLRYFMRSAYLTFDEAKMELLNIF